jgi:lipopolysaccharide/colanic/teichoic acid biosynthesis glycosyltransferase
MSLDELPQLFNVIWGNMSLVGPRPVPPTDVERYEPHHYERLSVVPGITGPWQVNGRNLITDFDAILQMERSYISEWSLLLDAKIMVRTIPAVLRGGGAY